MSYTALYRKFRPARFTEVKGQDPITRTLQNQVKTGRVGHAYLFCGTRGTGKTSVAKIFAKAVNCGHPVNGEPCGECAMCRAVSAGTSMNVIEIDAASNNSVNDIRAIRDEVGYRPPEGRYKVYIIDEAHMLSAGAANALLKTLEEPPEYVIFILATTEIHKIPVTIMSRCQRYDFKRISVDTIMDRLNELIGKEGLEAEERAVRFIARTADGAMRDALSLLDQCVAFYPGEKLTYEHALEILGTVDADVFGRLLGDVLDRNVAAALGTLEDLIMQGRDMSQMAQDFTWYLRNLLLAKSSDNIEDVLDVSAENLARMRKMAERTDAGTLIRYIRIFSDLSSRLRYATQKRVLFEVALIKLCKPEMETDMGSILDRIRVLEEQVEKGTAMKTTPSGGAAGALPEGAHAMSGGTQAGAHGTKNTDNADQRTGEVKKRSFKALPEDIKEVAGNFRAIANQTSGMLKACLKKAGITVGDRNQLLIVCDSSMAADEVNKENHIREIKNLIEKTTGRQMDIEVRHVEEGKTFNDCYADIEKLVKMEITVED